MSRTAAALFVVLLACSGDSNEGHKKRTPPATVVEATAVVLGGVADVLLASASVEAEASADVSPGTTGTVVSVVVDVGDTVRKGQLLAVINNANLDAGEAVAVSEARQLAARLEETERLFSSGAVSAREVEDLRHQARTATIRATEASRSAGETRLVAPFDGIVAAREVRVGELASGAKRAFQVVDLSRLRVRARLPERDLGRVRAGQVARLISAYDAEVTATAHVDRVAPVVDPATGTFEVLFAVDPGQNALRPGQYVSVELEVARHEPTLVVPRDAIVWDHGAPTLYRLTPAPPEPVDTDAKEEEPAEPAEEDEAAKPVVDEGPIFLADRVEVKVGLQNSGQAEILTGVAEGDRIVVVGQTTLKDGARVREPKLSAAADTEAPAAAPADGG